ncbi:MAG TPA: response regulator [Syntrophaceae bacterium]|nr:response regulator [Syntrophaceae bacterium]
MQEEKTKVLLIDDSVFMLSMISAMLKDTEFQVIDTAKNGAEGLQKYKDLKPDIVLLDIVMPDERGDETLLKILDYDPDAKIVMVSSLGTQEKVVESLKRGAKNFIQKPFERDDILRILKGVVK